LPQPGGHFEGEPVGTQWPGHGGQIFTLGLSHCPGVLSVAQSVCPGWLGQGCGVLLHGAGPGGGGGGFGRGPEAAAVSCPHLGPSSCAIECATTTAVNCLPAWVKWMSFGFCNAQVAKPSPQTPTTASYLSCRVRPAVRNRATRPIDQSTDMAMFSVRAARSSQQVQAG
jgi:hypothetical protein